MATWADEYLAMLDDCEKREVLANPALERTPQRPCCLAQAVQRRSTPR